MQPIDRRTPPRHSGRAPIETAQPRDTSAVERSEARTSVWVRSAAFLGERQMAHGRETGAEDADADGHGRDGAGRPQSEPGGPARGARWRHLLPWALSLGLMGAVLAGHDLAAVLEGIARAQLGLYVALLVVYLAGALACDAFYLWLSFRWFAACGPYLEMVRARGAAYLLSIVSMFVGMGGLVVYMHRRHGVPYRRGGAVMLNELLHELGALGALACLASFVVNDAAAVGYARLFGQWAFGAYLACFLASRLTRHLHSGRDRTATLAIFADQSASQFCRLLIIKLALNAWHGLFIGLALGAFGVDVPLLLAVAGTQIIHLARNLPLSAFGIGVDQVAFPAIFSFWDPTGGAYVLGFSVVYTFALILGRGLVGLVFIRGVIDLAREQRDERATH
jgi:hypothetical protein